MSKFVRKTTIRQALCLAALGLWLPGSVVLAALPGYWTGGGLNGRWDNGANWLSTTAMIGNATAFFTNDVPNNVITVTTTYNCKLVTFDTATGSYTIGGLGVNGGQTFTPFVAGGGVTLLATIIGSNLTETINAPLLLAAGDYLDNSRVEAGTRLVVAGNVSCNAASTTRVSSVSGSGTNLISGAISDSGFTHCILKSGAGQWTFSGSNTYSGGTILSAGILNINHAWALGTGPFFIGANTTNDNTSAGPITIANNNPMTWSGNFTFLGTRDLNLGAGAVSLATNAGNTRAITVVAGNLTVGGAISDGTTATNLTKTGAGTLRLAPATGTNAYSGNTTVSAGTLLLNGVLASSAGSMIVSNGATLGGTGFIYRVTTVTSNATLAAGDGALPGTLTTSNLALLRGAIVACDVSGGAMDRFVVNGTLTLPTNATVQITRTGSWPVSKVLFSATSLAGATNSAKLTGWSVSPSNVTVMISGSDVILSPVSAATAVLFR